MSNLHLPRGFGVTYEGLKRYYVDIGGFGYDRFWSYL